MRGARAGRWLRWGDATTLATARFPGLMRPSLGCGFPGGGADTGGHACSRMSGLGHASPQQGGLFEVLVGDTLGLGTLCAGSQHFLKPEGNCGPPWYPGLSHRSVSRLQTPDSRLTWLSCYHFWQAGPRDAEWAASLSVCAFSAGQVHVAQGSESSPPSWGPQKGC